MVPPTADTHSGDRVKFLRVVVESGTLEHLRIPKNESNKLTDNNYWLSTVKAQIDLTALRTVFANSWKGGSEGAGEKGRMPSVSYAFRRQREHPTEKDVICASIICIFAY